MDLKQTVSQIKLFYAAMFIGVLMFIVVAIIIHYILDSDTSLNVLPEQTLYLAIVLSAGALLLSDYMFKKNLTQLDSATLLKDKLSRYRSACILRVALIEIAALCIGTGYLLTGEILYLALYMVPVAFFAYTFPKDQNLINDLNLTYSEQEQLDMLSI